MTIETQGGTGIEGDANTGGGDFVNRDKNRIEQRVEVNVPPQILGRRPTLEDIYEVLAGNPLDDRPGLVAKVNKIDERVFKLEGKSDEVNQRLVNIERLVKERNHGSGRITLLPWQFILLLILLIVVMAFLMPYLIDHGSGGVRQEVFVPYMLVVLGVL